MPWAHHKTIMMGGLIAVGVDSSSRCLLAVSHSGRGLFDLASGERIARDYEDWAGRPWYSEDTNKCEGIGDLKHEVFDIVGLHGGSAYEATRDGSMTCRIECDGYDWKAFVSETGSEEEICSDDEDLKGIALSPDGRWFIVGISSEIDVYRNTNSEQGVGGQPATPPRVGD